MYDNGVLVVYVTAQRVCVICLILVPHHSVAMMMTLPQQFFGSKSKIIYGRYLPFLLQQLSDEAVPYESHSAGYDRMLSHRYRISVGSRSDLLHQVEQISAPSVLHSRRDRHRC